MSALEKAKQDAADEIAKGVKLPNGKNDKRAISKIHKALAKAYQDAGFDKTDAGNYAANFIMKLC